MGHRSRAVSLTMAVASIALTACGDDAGQEVDAALDDAAPTVAPSVAIADELAPSQVSASTVPEPLTPPPCEVSELEFASPRPDTGWSPFGAVIHITNAGAARCEVDVFESPSVDPLMEPDVWIDPGTRAELLVEPAQESCEQPAPVTSVDLVVNGTPVAVPVAIGEACGVLLTAIYAIEPPG